MEQIPQKHNLLVVQHGNNNGLHIYGYSSREIKKRRLKSVERNSKDKPKIEIMDSSKVITLPPSRHADGTYYQFIGGKTELKPEPFDVIEECVQGIYEKYDLLTVNNNDNGKDHEGPRIKELFKPSYKSNQGSRHDDLLFVTNSLLSRYRTLPKDKIKKMVWKWNQEHCIPPLPDAERKSIWKDCTEYQAGSSSSAPFKDLEGSKYYQTNKKPQRFIVAHDKRKQLIEMVARLKSRDDIAKTNIATTNKLDLYYLSDTKTFLACIPTKIIRHRNPLTFLDLPEKYSISFEDSTDHKFTLSHKTLSEIVAKLKERMYVLNDGVDSALSAILQAHKESKEIIDNEELEYTGFFAINNNKTIKASNVEIKEPIIADLEDALLLLEQLKKYYENREDFLATSMVWGMIAPAIFMLKNNNYFLKWLHLYGSPNAGKTNTGKIILALDGHHEDPEYNKKISDIDTIAKLGDTLSHSTFPKLIDEADLSNPDKAWLVNNLKSAIDSKIVRSKFMSSKASNATSIPALTPCIFTSNPSPPFHDSAFMKRILERYFPKSETWNDDNPKAIEFKGFIRINLKRLKALGDSRNWYIMNYQQEILDDESRPLPLDLGYKILEEAYKATGKIIPEWLSLRLPET